MQKTDYYEICKQKLKYLNYSENYEDSRVISASEQAFVSGCDWMRNEIE
jgi:hypothetical protein